MKMETDADQKQRPFQLLQDAFIRHAIDNNGLLTSTRFAGQVAQQINQLAIDYVNNQAGEAEIMTTTMQLAEQGLSYTTAAAMMHALHQADWESSADIVRLNEFQIRFLEKLAGNREYVQQKRQERTQLALQQALHNQLEQQRRLHQAQEQRNENLNQVLQLNARLVPITREAELLDQAVSGVCQALQLADVTIFDYHAAKSNWLVRTTTTTYLKNGEPAPLATASLLDAALDKNDETIQRAPAEHRQELVTMAIILRLDNGQFSGMVINSESLTNYSVEEFAILIRTFAQNLTALWRNLLLFTETKQRARELEILHGRYMDAIWNSETAALHAQITENNLKIERGNTALTLPPEQSVVMQVGDHPFGQIALPAGSSLETTDTEFAQAIIREMSNALNNARLLQAARSFSNQLNLAAEVSRAATTILDREQLVQEVVELIRARFDYYYVGLFLVDEEGKTAVLLAGTGEAGFQQVHNGHKLPLDGTSMISTAISQGHAHVEQDVRLARAFHRNPLLPDTQAELAVPLRTRGIITGALTIQSDQTGIFAQETIDVLQALADQLAVAIVNASLFARLQDNLAETSHLYEASQKISAATTDVAVYQALVDFARDSELADAAYMISHIPSAHEYFIIPIFWSRQPVDFNWQEQFLRDPLLVGEPLADKLTIINNCQKRSKLNPLTRHLAHVHQLGALALISIRIEGEWLATLALQRSSDAVFAPAELQPLLTLVDQSAVILSNQQLLKQAETLYRVSQLLSQALTRDDALQITVNQVAEYTGASQCRFIIYDNKSGMGRIVAEHRPSELAKQADFPVSEDFVFDYLNREMTPLLLDSKKDFPEYCLQKYVYQFGAKAALLIPAVSQQQLMGFLTIESHQGKRPFTQSNTIFAQTVVDHMTTQIENLNLLEEALSRAQELITLNQIQAGISGVLDLSNLAQTIYQQIGRLLDNTIFLLARYQTETSQYEPILFVQDGEPISGKPQFVPEGSPLHSLLFSQKHLIANRTHPIMQHSLISDLDRMPQSSLWIPLMDDNRPNGFLSLQSFQANRYSETDAQLLRSIATHTTLTIANARLFEEIQASNEQLRQLDNLKNQFLANVSHELRTPLNSIIGFSRIILKGIDGPITPDQEEDLTSIYENGQLLLALINDILDMAKIEAGRMTVTPELIDPVETAHKVLRTVKTLVNEASVKLEAIIEPDLPQIEADPVRLRQILNNLLSNAAKFTNEGFIRLLLERDGETHLHIAVADSGIGIHQQDYQALFKPFEQIENRDARVTGGTGLGLPITRWLVEMHNGRIWLESQPGQGSTFHVHLPLRQPEAPSTSAPEKTSQFA